MRRSGRWVVLVAMVASTVMGVSRSEAVSAQTMLPLPDPPTAREWYTPVVPARVLDTRPGMATIDGGGRPGIPLGPGQRLGVPVLGRGGVPSTGVSAVVMNVTATNPTGPTYLTVWPQGAARPTASNLNVVAGQTIPNLVVAKVGAGGGVDVFNFAGTVDVLVDVAGYVPSTDGFTPLNPARLLDTRPGFSTIDTLGRPGTPLGGAGQLDLPILGRGGVPTTGVDAVVLNVTATNVTAPSFITVHPAGSPRPTASNLNMVPGQTVPNLVVAKLGASGMVTVYNHNGSADVVADVAGYFAAGGTFVALTPQRIFETRSGEFIPPGAVNRGQTIGPDQAIDVEVTGRAGVPDFGVAAVVLNVTAIRPAGPSYLTVWPTGTARPNASNLNVRGNEIVPNLVIAKVGAGGKVSIYNYAGRTDLVVDVAGYFEAETGAIRDVDASGTSTCTLFEVGTAWCWGTTPQDPGSVYPGVQSVRPVPYEIETVDDAVEIAVGEYHTCVIRTGGAVWCWAAPTVFNLAGNGAPGEWIGAWPHIQVRLPRPAVEIDASYNQTCALLVDSTVWCWGLDFGGANRPLPWPVGNLDGVVQVSLGSLHGCALKADGTVGCWGGAAQFGGLGDGSGADSPTQAVAVAGLSDADGITVSGFRSCATRTAGGVRCWGQGPLLPDDLDDANGNPVTDVLQIAHGDTFSCILRVDGQVSCGTGTQVGSPVPGLPSAVYLAAGRFHVCAVTATSDLYCWGDNAAGQLGDGTLVSRSSPTLIIDS
jgi:alpha-tubulin suppressor-like RCC1 family protein